MSALQCVLESLQMYKICQAYQGMQDKYQSNSGTFILSANDGYL